MARWVVGVVVASLLTATSASADDTHAVRKAKAAFDQAETLYRLQRFGEALARYRAALELAKRPGIVFAIAQCHRMLGQPCRAVFYYKLFLSDWVRAYPGKPITGHAEVKAHIATLPCDQQTDDGDRDHDEARPRWPRAVGWAAVGVGAASITAGLVLGKLVSDRVDAYNDGHDDKTYGELSAIADEGRRLETAHFATLIAGGVVAAAGVGLLVWSYVTGGAADKRSARIAPIVGERTAGIVAHVSF